MHSRDWTPFNARKRQSGPFARNTNLQLKQNVSVDPLFVACTAQRKRPDRHPCQFERDQHRYVPGLIWVAPTSAARQILPRIHQCQIWVGHPCCITAIITVGEPLSSRLLLHFRRAAAPASGGAAICHWLCLPQHLQGEIKGPGSIELGR